MHKLDEQLQLLRQATPLLRQRAHQLADAQAAEVREQLALVLEQQTNYFEASMKVSRLPVALITGPVLYQLVSSSRHRGHQLSQRLPRVALKSRCADAGLEGEPAQAAAAPGGCDRPSPPRAGLVGQPCLGPDEPRDYAPTRTAQHRYRCFTEALLHLSAAASRMCTQFTLLLCSCCFFRWL